MTRASSCLLHEHTHETLEYFVGVISDDDRTWRMFAGKLGHGRQGLDLTTQVERVFTRRHLAEKQHGALQLERGAIRQQGKYFALEAYPVTREPVIDRFLRKECAVRACH